jgi:hypothetical protein
MLQGLVCHVGPNSILGRSFKDVFFNEWVLYKINHKPNVKKAVKINKAHVFHET